MNSLTKLWQENHNIKITFYCPDCRKYKSHIVELTPDMVDEILLIGFMFGIRHWCSKTEILESNYLGMYDSEQVSRGGSVILYDKNETGVHILNLDNFLVGFCEVYAMSVIYHWWEHNPDGRWKFSNRISDYIIQYALFKKIKYPHKEDNGGNCYVNKQ